MLKLHDMFLLNDERVSKVQDMFLLDDGLVMFLLLIDYGLVRDAFTSHQ